MSNSLAETLLDVLVVQKTDIVNLQVDVAELKQRDSMAIRDDIVCLRREVAELKAMYFTHAEKDFEG